MSALLDDEKITAETVEQFMANLMGGLTKSDEDMIEAIQSLRDQGVKLAVLTNNWKSASLETSCLMNWRCLTMW